jgi:hypothetical protein
MATGNITPKELETSLPIFLAAAWKIFHEDEEINKGITKLGQLIGKLPRTVYHWNER